MRHGFSLVETIVTLVLFFVLAGMSAQLFSTPYRETARSVQRTADQCRIVEVMEQLVADSLYFQEHTDSSSVLDSLNARIAAQRYGDDVRITTLPMSYRAGMLAGVQLSTGIGTAAKGLFAASSPALLLCTVEKNGMRLSRVFSN